MKFDMVKAERQEAIINLINAKNIETQSELTNLLSASGFEATQSSVSRDLDELGVIKVTGFYAIPNKTKFTDFGLLSLEIAGENLIVAKTEIGFAAAVCVRIDNAKIAEIVGTIAGEDTIFIAVRNQKEQKTAMRKIWEIFEK